MSFTWFYDISVVLFGTFTEYLTIIRCCFLFWYVFYSKKGINCILIKQFESWVKSLALQQSHFEQQNRKQSGPTTYFYRRCYSPTKKQFYYISTLLHTTDFKSFEIYLPKYIFSPLNFSFSLYFQKSSRCHFYTYNSLTKFQIWISYIHKFSSIHSIISPSTRVTSNASHSTHSSSSSSDEAWGHPSSIQRQRIPIFEWIQIIRYGHDWLGTSHSSTVHPWATASPSMSQWANT